MQILCLFWIKGETERRMLPELVSPIPPNRETGPFRVPAEFSVEKIMIDGRVVKSCKQAASNFLPECVYRHRALSLPFKKEG